MTEDTEDIALNRIFKKATVLEEARERIRFLFDEFPEVIVNFSGGKDSTIVLNLAIEIAREKGRLPIKVFFIDQEAEWQAAIDYVRDTMDREEVEPWWFQIPIQLFNASSHSEHWLWCWNPDDEANWMRPKEPDSVHENVYGETRFHELFNTILNYHFPNTRVAKLSGVRTEESPSRWFGLTSYPTYKWITWGKKENVEKGHYTFAPIYDWSYSDVWKAIHDHGWQYCRLYDRMYQYGVPVRNMRVSNLHHETAVSALFILQEVEPETYAKLTQRLSGVDMAGKMGFKDYFPSKLPFMFESWREYRDHLFDKLVDPEYRPGMRAIFDRQEQKYHDSHGEKLYKMHVKSILTNDWEGVKLKNFDDSFDKTHQRRRENASQ